MSTAFDDDMIQAIGDTISTEARAFSNASFKAAFEPTGAVDEAEASADVLPEANDSSKSSRIPMTIKYASF